MKILSICIISFFALLSWLGVATALPQKYLVPCPSPCDTAPEMCSIKAGATVTVQTTPINQTLPNQGQPAGAITWNVKNVTSGINAKDASVMSWGLIQSGHSGGTYQFQCTTKDQSIVATSEQLRDNYIPDFSGGCSSTGQSTPLPAGINCTVL